MDPQYEQRLRDEVIYLHSLWRQGPPRTAAHRHFATTSKPQFKKKKPKTPEIPSSSTKEWPCSSTPPKSATSLWPEMPPHSSQVTPLTPEEIAKSTSRTLHRNAFKTVRKFLITDNRSSSDNDSDDDDEEEEEDDDGLTLDDDGREEYTFFFKVFKEDDELRDYYEKHYVNGDFSCLVCGALGGKGMGKKFKGCLPLVQHSVTIAKTKRKKAHRAFGQVVCKVLGWDLDRLPSVVSSLSGISGEGEVSVHGDGEKDKEILMIVNAGSLEIKEGKLVADSGSIGAGVSSNGDQSNKVIAVGGSGIVHADNVNSNGGVEHEGGTALANNVEILESTGGEVAAWGGNIHDSTLSNSNVNSSLCCPGGENLKEPDVMHPHVVEATAADGLTSIPSIFPDCYKNVEELDTAFEYEAKEPPQEGLTIKLLTHHSADKNLEKTPDEEKTTTVL